MSHKVVFGIAKADLVAEGIVDNLRNMGVSLNDVSVLIPDRAGSQDFAHEHSTKAPEGTATGVSAGGVVGGALGLLAGVGLLAIPGAGPFIAAGPIMAALSGAAVGATLGGITGALIGLGIPEYEAKVYEKKIRDGNILIAVHTHDSDETKRVKDFFKSADVEDIGVASSEDANRDQRAARAR
jgi:uncharacterized membrane protein